jgi:tetratricopeptide (TPR) repeat protein
MVLCVVLAQAGFSLILRPFLVRAQDRGFESLLKEGFELHRQQQYHRAIPLLEQARIRRPADYFVNLLLGIDHLRTGESQKALPYLETARKTRRNDPMALGYLAEAHSALGQFDKAVEALQLSALQPGASEQNRFDLIKFYLRRFRAVAEELRSTTTGLAYSYQLQALALRDRRDPKEREVLLRARSLAPQLPGLESALGHLHLSAARWDQAREAFARARAQNPDDLDLLVGEAIVAAQSNDWPKSELLLGEVGIRSRNRLKAALRDWPLSLPVPRDVKHRLTAAPRQSQASSLSQGFSQLFQQQRWESLVEKLGSRPAKVEESWWLGTALARLERFAEAIGPLEKARTDAQFKTQSSYWLALSYARAVEKINSQLSENRAKSPFLHLVRGEIMLRLTLDGPSAAAEYRQAAAALPNDPAAWTGLAEAQMLAGDTHKARESANRALRLDARRFEASQVLGEACIQERDYEAAIPPLQRALQAQPLNLKVRLLLGTALSRTGRDQEALPLLDSVLKGGYPDEKGSLHYLLGSVLRRLGRAKDSELAFERAKELSDSFAGFAHGEAADSRQPAPNLN